MRIPEYLKKGDIIGIAATARKISEEELNRAVNYLQNYGFKIKFAEHLFEEENQFAGRDEIRAKGFQSLLDDSSVKAILCARGGYGTVRIIDHINFENFIRRPKWIVGYSDITVLHAHIQQNYAVETMHAIMPLDFPAEGEDDISARGLCQSLEGKVPTYKCSAHHLNKLGRASGEVVGGNLSILYSLSGSNSQVSTLGRILFIEDLDEYLYHIDRMLMNLSRTGMLEGIKALIVGGMSDMNDNSIPFGKTAEEIIEERVSKFDFPVCYGFPAGHVKPSMPLIMGRRAELAVDENEVVLKFLPH